MMPREVFGMCLIAAILITLVILSEYFPYRRRKQAKKPVYGRNVKPDLNGHRWVIIDAEFIDLDEEERKRNEERRSLTDN